MSIRIWSRCQEKIQIFFKVYFHLNIMSSGWKQKDLGVTNPSKEFTYPGLFMSRVCHRCEAWFCEAVVVHREQAATKQMW